MSTTTNNQDQESVTVPLDLGLLQSLLSLQVLQLQQKGQAQPNTAPNRAPVQAREQGQQSKPAQNRPQTGPAGNRPNESAPFKKQFNQGTNLNSNNDAAGMQEAKKDQNKPVSTSAGNAQNPLALLSQLSQLMGQGGLGNLLALAGQGNQNSQQNQNQNQNSRGANMNETSNGSMSRGANQSKFKYSSTLGGERPAPGLREDSNSRTRPFPNRQGDFNNNSNGPTDFRNNSNGPTDFRNNSNGPIDFRNRGNNNFRGNNRGNFQQRGQMRGRGGFNSENGNGENGRFQGRNQGDFSRSRGREKSNDFRQGVFGGLNPNGMNMNRGRDGNGGARAPFPLNTRKGDWQCPNQECNNINFATRSLCNRCGGDKPQELLDMEEERRNNAPTFKKGDWNCPSCKNLNFARRSNCNRCGENRPEETYEDFRPAKHFSNQDQGDDFGNGNDNYEPGEVSNDNHKNEWVKTAGNDGNEGLEEGEVAEEW